jgi:hypothetical protein
MAQNGCMRVALGLKAHSGWAVLVAVGDRGDAFEVVERSRVELIEAGDEASARQPYHAAEGAEPVEAREIVRRGTEGAQRAAIRELRAAAGRMRDRSHEAVACAVLVPAPMPAWSTEEILAVHFRMHKAEGVLFPDALVRAAEACGLTPVAIAEKLLMERAERALSMPPDGLINMLTILKKSVGAPWGRDQKWAALAALVALREP